MKAIRTNQLIWGAFGISTLLGGLNAIGVRYTVMELAPFWGATIRMAPAALILIGVVIVLKLPLPRGKELLGNILFGALNFGGSYFFLYYSLEHLLPGMAQVILALVPLLTLLFAFAHRQESFRWNVLAGALLSLGGVALVFREQIQSHIPLYSLLAVLLAAACFAEGSVVAKSFPKSHPVTTSAVGMATGAVILFVMSLIWREPLVLPVKLNTWIALVYLILLGSVVMFLLVLYLLKHWTASALSYQFVLLPFVSLSASSLLGLEKLSSMLLVGGSLVLIGVFIGVFFSPQKRAVKEPAAVSVEVDPSPCLECE